MFYLEHLEKSVGDKLLLICLKKKKKKKKKNLHPCKVASKASFRFNSADRYLWSKRKFQEYFYQVENPRLPCLQKEKLTVHKSGWPSVSQKAVMTQAFSSVGLLALPEGLLQALTTKREKDGGTLITDLPAVVLGSILCQIDDPVDAAAAICASRHFWALSLTVPFHLRLRPRHFEDNVASSDDPLQSRYGAQMVGAWTRAALSGIRKYMPATQELDLAGCPVVDDDIAAVLTDLQCLERLVLDGCQKLTSAVADALAVSVRSGPRALSLQRCYRLGPIAAGNLLAAAAAADRSKLQCILLSHLDRLEFPRDSLLLDTQHNEAETDAENTELELGKAIGNVNTGAGLRLLALNNCGGLGASELAAVAMTCPLLELLLLGGSVEGLGLCRPEALQQEKAAAAASALVQTTEALARIRVLEITFFTSAVTQAVREQNQKGIQVWDFCDEGSVAAAADMVESLKKLGQKNAVSVRSPLECTLGASTIPDKKISTNMRDQFEQDVLRRLEYWGSGSMQCHNVSGCGKTGTCFSFPQSEDRWESSAEDVMLALRAAANCSDIRRRTPLHVAAIRGDVSMTAGLLSVGAAAKGTKDSAGATALFVAAECGHAYVCELLLQGGADVLASNRAGETPLYIAALRGHSAAVGIMLAHCHEHGVNWQDADVYGDGWTPLMAATVADRQDVGKVLLWAAGALLGMGSHVEREPLTTDTNVVAHFVDSDKVNDQEASTMGKETCNQESESTDCIVTQSKGKSKKKSKRGGGRDGSSVLVLRPPPQLLDAQNRYGQTALHIAARRASVWFVANLLSAGASLDVRDAYGMRAIDIAHRQSHAVVADILKQWESVQHKKVGTPPNGSTPSCPAAVGPSEKGKKILKGNLLSSNPSKVTSSQATFYPSSDMTRASICYCPSCCSSNCNRAVVCLETSPMTRLQGIWSKPYSCRENQGPSTGVVHGMFEGTEDLEGNVLDVVQETGLKSNASEGHRSSQSYWRGRGTRRRVFSEGRISSSTS